MRKKILAALLSLSLLATLCVGTAFAEEAAPTNDSLICDGVLQTPTVYKINGSNYFKIRDLAAILNGSAKQFSVGYDADKKSVTADTGAGYLKQPTDLTGAPAGGNKTATASSDAIYINGVLCQAEVYKIDGMNYFKLRDLGQALNFAVGWDGATGTVTLDTTKGYETQTPSAQNISDSELLLTAKKLVAERNDLIWTITNGGFVEYDENDTIMAGQFTVARVTSHATLAEAVASAQEMWYRIVSRRSAWLWTDEELPLTEHNGALYFILDSGIGDDGSYEVIDRLISRTSDTAVFSGRWTYGEDDPSMDTPFELSLVFEDGVWKCLN